MDVLVLGSAAGGGSPQWNCACDVCEAVRAREPGTQPRTQASVAVSADGERWVLLNASPDLRQQLNDQPALHPQQTPRHTPIDAVVVTNGDIDHIAGLLTVREDSPFSLYAHNTLHDTLNQSAVFDVLDRDTVPRRSLDLDTPTELHAADGTALGLTLTAFPVPGKVALYDETDDAIARIGDTTPDTLGLQLTTDTGARCVVITSCAKLTPDLKDRLDGADVLFFDGTLWADDEMVQAGLSAKTGARMGHMSISGPNGTLAAFSDVDIARPIFIHLNNSNPVLLADSPERAAVEDAGWEAAYDGMRLELDG